MHGEDAGRATAFNGRCWARALLNRELERALADYDAAVAVAPRNAWALYLRGIALARAGKADAAAADRKAALAINPGVAKRAARFGLDG